jgi:fasciclin 1
MVICSKTFWLGQSDRFNEQLNSPYKRFTYFVPRDSAWDKAELHYPSTHKKLFMRDFQYHVIKLFLNSKVKKHICLLY